MTMHNQIFENVWPPSLDSKNRLQNFQDMVESTIQRCFEITHFRRKIQQILEFQKVENQTVQHEIIGLKPVPEFTFKVLILYWLITSIYV